MPYKEAICLIGLTLLRSQQVAIVTGSREQYSSQTTCSNVIQHIYTSQMLLLTVAVHKVLVL